MPSHRTIRLIHLSDIHFGRDHCFNVPNVQNLPAGLNRDFLTTLIAHLKHVDDAVDGIIISGDLTSTGMQSEFYEATRFISQLMQQLGIGNDRLIVVPGNHDVLWTREDEVASRAEFDSFVSRLFGRAVDELAISSLRVGNVYLLGLDLTRLETPRRRGVGFAGYDPPL